VLSSLIGPARAGWRVIVLALVVLLLAAGASASRAEAGTLAPEVSSQLDDIEAAIEEGGIPNGRAPSTCSEMCAKLVDAEQAAVSSAKTVEKGKFLAQMWRLRSAALLLPELGALPELAAYGSFQLGFKIGTLIRSKFARLPAPAEPTTLGPAQFVSRGQVVLTTGNDTIHAPATAWSQPRAARP
jgi:hypothetical protein